MNILEFVLDFIFPKICVGCGMLGTYLCPECHRTISFYQAALCPGCMKAIYPLGVHKSCQAKTTLDGLYTIAKHEGVMHDLISSVKYKGTFDMTKLLGTLMAWHLEKSDLVPSSIRQSPVILVPVPMHWKKENERGFNQSKLLAQELSKKIHLPSATRILKKTKQTKPQVNLKRNERLKNQTQVFFCPYVLTDHPTVILVDDVVTTGATLSACAKVLKTAGARKVYAIALAHGR